MFRYFILPLIMVGFLVPSMAQSKEVTLLCESSSYEALGIKYKHSYERLFTIDITNSTYTIWWVEQDGERFSYNRTDDIRITPSRFIIRNVTDFGFEYVDRQTGVMTSNMMDITNRLSCEETRKPRTKF